MDSQYPETIMLSPERLHSRALRQIPHTNCLILSAGYDELVLRVEKRSGNVVEVASTSIHLPSLRLTHPPNLDLPVIRSRDNERQGGMEGSKVDSTVVTFKNVFDGREVVKCIESTRCGIWCALAEAGDVPDTDCLVLRCRNNQVFFGVELSRHHVVGMTREDRYAVS